MAQSFPSLRPLKAGLLMLALVTFLPVLQGCASDGSPSKGAKIALTPVVVVRDVVDAPLVTVANVFEFFADQSHLAKAPTAGGGYNIFGGNFYANIGYDFSYILWKSVSIVVGGVDYIICRSLWPNWPKGLSPWVKKGYGWGDLYFSNTRILWGDERPYQRHRDVPEPENVPR